MTDLSDLQLGGMAHGGEAVGRADDGRVVFVGGGLPGERVAVRLTEQHERYLRGVIAAVPHEPSPDREAEPACPHFGRWPDRGQRMAAHCGGCQWQHVSYEAQLRLKAEVLGDQLTRLGGIESPDVAATLPMPEPWRYRNRIRLHMGPEGLGFVALDGASVSPVSVCPITHPAVLELMASVEGDLPVGVEIDLRAGIHTGDRLIGLCGSDEALDGIEIESRVEASVVLVRDDGGTELAAGRPFLVEQLAGRPFIIPAQSFFQVNTGMAETLVSLVRDVVPDGIGVLADVHSGVGTFAILLADRADEVFAIESDPAAVGAAVENATGMDNITLLEADASEGLAYLERPPDVIVLDPPRTGLDRATVGLLTGATADRIVYVSCEPATLARDARQLAAGGWGLVRSMPVDVFPQTFHIESVNVFERT